MAGLLSTTQNTNSLAIFSKIRQIKEDTQGPRDQTHLIFTQVLNFSDRLVSAPGTLARRSRANWRISETS
jgi:hypothetical protein